MPTDSMSIPEASRRAELTYRQVSYWVAVGAIKPASGTGGSGNPYRFTERQAWMLGQIGVVYRLLEELDIGGPTTEFIRRVWDSLESTGQFHFTDGPLVITLPWPPEGAEPAA